MDDDRGYFCPSGQPDMADPVVFGLVTGTVEEPRVGYLEAAVTLDQLPGLTTDADVNTIARIGARCEQDRCAHFEEDSCTLAQRIDHDLPAVVNLLPRCSLRSRCRWFAEQGESICRKCPQVVTLDNDRPGNEPIRVAATPPAP